MLVVVSAVLGVVGRERRRPTASVLRSPSGDGRHTGSLFLALYRVLVLLEQIRVPCPLVEKR